MLGSINSLGDFFFFFFFFLHFTLGKFWTSTQIVSFAQVKTFTNKGIAKYFWDQSKGKIREMSISCLERKNIKAIHVHNKNFVPL